MPDFTHDGHVYYKPLEFAMAHISDRQLAAALRELEQHGLVSRKVYAEVPPHTEYALTPHGEQAIPVIETLRLYGLDLMKAAGIKSEFYFPKKKVVLRKR